ncbi:MAG: T9SS C-terminal target domain-containing protein [Ignavibacteriae bacterium]|nr:MAG: T9SS C-terminal target domain-containing protein [Ignavibacteriota bacterium]
MKKLILLFVLLSFITYGIIFSQSKNNPYNSNSESIDVMSISPGVNGTGDVVGAQCVGGLVYDDNTFENAYGWNAGSGVGKYVMKFTPNIYPYTFNQVCLALTRTTSGTANFTFDIVVYDTLGLGGAPGNLIATVPNQTVSNIPIWPTVSWYDFTGLTGIAQLISGSYYIGVSWNPATAGFHFIGADENSTPRIPGFGYINSTWSSITSWYSGYQKIGVRADGIATIYTHNVAAGPFLSFPPMLIVNTSYQIKAKITNRGTTNESGIPVKFFVDGVQINSININLNAGQADSVSFNWVPTNPVYYNLKIVTALATDEHRPNDTVSTNVLAYPNGVMYCNGTGTTAVQYPFYTYYMDSKTDMLYLSSEIGTGGLPMNIYTVGFNVISPASQVMNGFKLKMKNTIATSISSFELSGWTEVYNGSYAISGSGWRFITLQTPFMYTGNNLLIEICYNNSSWTLSSTVASTAKTGRVYHAHQDLSTGNGCLDIISGALQTTLPNICLSPWVGIEPKTPNEIPQVYSLEQNYPNPFNPVTIINYQLPMSSEVKLIIYDVTGREVALLVNQKQNAGEYEIEWNAADYPSGVYFYKLEAGDFSQTKKMVLMK